MFSFIKCFGHSKYAGKSNYSAKWARAIAVFAVLALSVPPETAFAFSRGMASKVRALQSQAYDQRLANAREAFAARDYKKSVQEAALALQHASTPDKARPVHKLLADAYKKLGDKKSAEFHLASLKK